MPQQLGCRAGRPSRPAQVVQAFGAAHLHHAYLFANHRDNRMKVMVQDGIGVRQAARRLIQMKFIWPDCVSTLVLACDQLDVRLALLHEAERADSTVLRGEALWSLDDRYSPCPGSSGTHKAYTASVRFRSTATLVERVRR